MFVLTSAFAHSGRTDKYGGHHDRKNGGYHYHNAGYVHAAGNPYQDHTKCGICQTSKKIEKSVPENFQITEYQKTFALQAGLKCMGYHITEVDGKMGPETKAAIAKFAKDHNLDE